MEDRYERREEGPVRMLGGRTDLIGRKRRKENDNIGDEGKEREGLV